jgi:pimeloyl-ACP methyl ester carboxylesterase
MASLGFRVTRTLFRLGDTVAPGLAGRAAFALFARTPHPGRQTEGERKAVMRGAAFMQTARHHRLKAGPDCFVVHEFRPQPGTEIGRALVIHGWRSRTEYMQAVIEGLNKAGFRVYAVDLPGHGASTGRRLTMMKAVAAVGQAGQWFGPFDVVAGHSFGGAVAVNTVAGVLPGVPPLQAGRLVLIAAPNSMAELLDDFCRTVGLGGRSREAMVGCIERIAQCRLDAFTGSRQLAAANAPALVVHAPEDREVPAADARAYASAGSHVALHWAPGLGHRRILSDPGVVARIVSFARQPLALALAG